MSISDLLKGKNADLSGLAIMASTVKGFALAEQAIAAQPTQRERLASAALQGLLASGEYSQHSATGINAINARALLHADDLIAKLNGPVAAPKQSKRDTEYVEVTIEGTDDGRYIYGGKTYDTPGEAMQAVRDIVLSEYEACGDIVLSEFEACGECPGYLAEAAESEARAQKISDAIDEAVKNKTRH